MEGARRQMLLRSEFSSLPPTIAERHHPNQRDKYQASDDRPDDGPYWLPRQGGCGGWGTRWARRTSGPGRRGCGHALRWNTRSCTNIITVGGVYGVVEDEKGRSVPAYGHDQGVRPLVEPDGRVDRLVVGYDV